MRNKKLLFTIILLPFVLSMCAKMLTPVGGPKDTTPPSVVKMQPGARTTNFNETTFKITFDEYITLNNPTENTIFSPPLKHAPKFSVSNKTMKVKIADTLRPNTTYNVVFTDCIKDFTENNPMPFFQYTFSTGDHIDTFSYSGKLTDAKATTPVKNCLVFLYREDIDSLPLTTRPDYITKTLTDGTFRFDNISEGNYKIFALKDINNNLIYDLPNEEIAFGDATVKAIAMPQPVQPEKQTPESKKESKKKKKNSSDTTAAQTTAASPTPVADSVLKSHELMLFTEKDTTLKLLSVKNTANGIYTISYSNAVPEPVIKFSDPQSALPFHKTLCNTKDTLTLYFKELPTDTLRIELTTEKGIDTIALPPFKTKPAKNSRSKKKEKEERLHISAHNSGELYKPFIINFSYPIKPADKIEYMVVKKKKSGNDTTIAQLSVPDTFITKIVIPFDKEEKVPYNISIRDSVFYGYNGLTNDSLSFNFTIQSEKDYGTLVMNYSLEKQEAYIIELLTTNNSVIQKDVITASKKITYDNLKPGEYKIKVIEDRNRNGEWDTGNYYRKEQPEQIFYFAKKITIRGYWELEEDFILKKQ